jgi:hypothetical protein
MKHTLAAFVIAAIPAAGFAQSQAAAQGNPAAEHLAAARAALNKVLNAPAPTGDAFKKLSEVKTEYIALEKSASTASPDWAAHYSAIDRLVGELLGAPATASGEAGAVGTSGQTAMKGVDPAMASNLSTFRTELKSFSTAMSAVAPVANTTAAPSPSAQSSAAGSSQSPAAAAPAGSPSATATSGSAAASPSPTGTSGSVVAGTAPRSMPIPAPAPSASAMPANSGTSAAAAEPASAASGSGASPSADTGLAAQIDPVIALVDAALAANPVDASGKVTVDRATLDAIKAQLQVIKAKKQ